MASYNLCVSKKHFKAKMLVIGQKKNASCSNLRRHLPLPTPGLHTTASNAVLDRSSLENVAFLLLLNKEKIVIKKINRPFG